jgi:hypothetical protein
MSIVGPSLRSRRRTILVANGRIADIDQLLLINLD